MYKLLITLSFLISACAHSNTTITIKSIKVKNEIGKLTAVTNTVPADDTYNAIIDLTEDIISKSNITTEHIILIDDSNLKYQKIHDKIKSYLSEKELNFRGYSEIEYLLKLEKYKDNFGCDRVSCIVEIGGALDADYVLIYNIYNYIPIQQAIIKKHSSQTLREDEQLDSIYTQETVAETSARQNSNHAPDELLGIGVAGLILGGIIAGVGAIYNTPSSSEIKTQVDAYNATNERKNYTPIYVGAGIAGSGLLTILVSELID